MCAFQRNFYHPVLVCLMAWLLPGWGHLWLGRFRTGLILLIALLSMFAIGIGLEGSLFPFNTEEPFVFLGALANLGIGALYFFVRFFNLDEGRVVAVAYEHGNTFLIVAGLLNFLVILDAYDIALGRK